MANTWILVAESSRAKFYATNNRLDPPTEIDALVHPESRMHEGDLISDGAGSDGGSVGQGRHVMNHKTSAREHESLGFAKEIANRLDSARNQVETPIKQRIRLFVSARLLIRKRQHFQVVHLIVGLRCDAIIATGYPVK